MLRPSQAIVGPKRRTLGFRSLWPGDAAHSGPPREVSDGSGILEATAGYSSTMTEQLTVPPRDREGDRERWAEELLDRLTPVMSALGLVFLLVVLGEQLARPGSLLGTSLAVLGWLLWAAFVTEFVARHVVAPDKGRFWRRNWWQLVFLALPFLRFLRLLRAARVLRTGRVLSSAVRSSRSARTVLGGRLGWLAAVSAITVLGSSQLLYQFSGYERYGDALHAAALATVTGEPLGRADGFSQVLEVALAVFSVVVFATLAGSLGAYFLEARAEDRTRQGEQAPDKGEQAPDRGSPPAR